MLEESDYQQPVFEVNDRCPSLKQKVVLAKTTITEGQSLSVKLKLIVELYNALADGSYGELATGNGVNQYPVYLNADNNCAVHPDTGFPAYQLITMQNVRNLQTGEETILVDQNFREFIMALPDMYQLQGDWFNKQLKDPTASVRQLQQYFILAADQPPYSKFSAVKVAEPIASVPVFGGALTASQIMLESEDAEEKTQHLPAPEPPPTANA